MPTMSGKVIPVRISYTWWRLLGWTPSDPIALSPDHSTLRAMTALVFAGQPFAFLLSSSVEELTLKDKQRFPACFGCSCAACQRLRSLLPPEAH